jgi:hypothetical protein
MYPPVPPLEGFGSEGTKDFPDIPNVSFEEWCFDGSSSANEGKLVWLPNLKTSSHNVCEGLWDRNKSNPSLRTVVSLGIRDEASSTTIPRLVAVLPVGEELAKDPQPSCPLVETPSFALPLLACAMEKGEEDAKLTGWLDPPKVTPARASPRASSGDLPPTTTSFPTFISDSDDESGGLIRVASLLVNNLDPNRAKCRTVRPFGSLTNEAGGCTYRRL